MTFFFIYKCYLIHFDFDFIIICLGNFLVSISLLMGIM